MQKRTFTLIEMLIVVVIIGILAAALIPRLQSVQARARDIKRKADLHQIGTALEIYKEDNGNYTSFATAKNNGNSYLRGGVDDTTRTIANKESYDTYYQ
ncbi:MAG: prepilin-type N-terminal cleavage/methylation domain-containing protein [bacterium]